MAKGRIPRDLAEISDLLLADTEPMYDGPQIPIGTIPTKNGTVTAVFCFDRGSSVARNIAALRELESIVIESGGRLLRTAPNGRAA